MDAYRIGVSIALANGVSPILAIISRDLLGLKTKIGDIEKSFGRWAAAAGGVAGILGGTAILGTMGKLVKHGSEIVHQQELMKIAGMTNEEIAQATAKAYETSAKVQSTSISENLEHLRELRYAFGHLDVASKYLEIVSKSNAILNSVKGGGQDQVWELVKSLEQKGETINPESFVRYVDIMSKAVIASGGKVTPSQFFQAFKYGRTAMLGWDETFVGQYLPRLIQSMSSGSGGMGGQGQAGPGNALMSAFAKVVQGQMPKKAAQEFDRLGLTTSYRDIKGSSAAQADIVGANLFAKNPYEWVQSVLMPALKKAGITEQTDVIQEISRLFPVRTASQIIGEMALQGRFREGANSPFEKDAALQRSAWDTVRAQAELSGYDPKLIMESFHKQWESMLQALGSPLVAPAMEAMKSITGVFTSITQFASEHPTAIRVIGESLAALAVGLVALGGTALVLAIAPLVGASGLIAGLAAALGVLAAVNWSSITDGFKSVWKSLTDGSAWEAVKKQLAEAWSAQGPFWGRLAEAFRNGLATLPGLVAGAITSTFSAIGAAIANAIKKLNPFGGNGPSSPVPPQAPDWKYFIPGAYHGPARKQQSPLQQINWQQQQSPLQQIDWRPSQQQPSILQGANWQPPQQQAQPIYVTSKIDIDGRTLAESIQSQIAAMLAFPTQAPFPDGRQAWLPPDGQVVTT